MPDVLYPDVSARCEKQPLYRDEQVADDIRGDSNADEEHRESLQRL